MSLVAQMARDLESHCCDGQNHQVPNDIAATGVGQSQAGASPGRLPLFAAAEQLYGNGDAANRSGVLLQGAAWLLLAVVLAGAVYTYLQPQTALPSALASTTAADNHRQTIVVPGDHKPGESKTVKSKTSGSKANSVATVTTAPNTAKSSGRIEPGRVVQQSVIAKESSITKTRAIEESGVETHTVNTGHSETATVLKSESNTATPTSVVIAATKQDPKVIQSLTANSPTLSVKTSRPLSNAQRDAKIVQEANRLLDNGLRASAIAYLENTLADDYSKINSGSLYLSLLIEAQRFNDVAALLPQYQQSSVVGMIEALLLAKIEVRLAIAQQRYIEAVTLIDRLAIPLQRDADFTVMRAAALQAQGEYSQAAASYKHLLAFNSQQARWWMGLAVALDADAKFSEAKQAYRNALSLAGSIASASLPDNLSHYATKRIAQL